LAVSTESRDPGKDIVHYEKFCSWTACMRWRDWGVAMIAEPAHVNAFRRSLSVEGGW
jgi:hypothetical protein